MLSTVNTDPAIGTIWGRTNQAGYSIGAAIDSSIGAAFDSVLDLYPDEEFDVLVTAARQQLVLMGRTLTTAAELMATALAEYFPDDLGAIAGLLADGGYTISVTAAALAALTDARVDIFLAVWASYSAASASTLVTATGITIAAAATAATALTTSFALTMVTLMTIMLDADYSASAVSNVMADRGQSASWVAQRLRITEYGVTAVANALVDAFTLNFAALFNALVAGGFTASAAQAAACAVLGC